MADSEFYEVGISVDPKSYLRSVAQLEVSIDEQQRVLEKLEQKESILRQRPPQEPRPLKLDRKTAVDKSADMKERTGGPAGVVFFGLITLALGVLLYFIMKWDTMWLILIKAALLIGIFVLFVKAGLATLEAAFEAAEDKSKNEQIRKDIEAAKKQYEIDIVDAEKYNAAQEKREKETDAANLARYEKQVEIHKQDIRDIDEQIDLMKTGLTDARATLKRLYDMDVIKPTYRNLEAVAMMYQYFEDDIVTGFTGPDGAYARYRDEKRDIDHDRHTMEGLAAIANEVALQTRHNNAMFQRLLDDSNQKFLQMEGVINQLGASIDDLSDMTRIAAYNASKAAETAEISASYAKDTSRNAKKAAAMSSAAATQASVAAEEAKRAADNTDPFNRHYR
jgi:hypothetical protein